MNHANEAQQRLAWARDVVIELGTKPGPVWAKTFEIQGHADPAMMKLLLDERARLEDRERTAAIWEESNAHHKETMASLNQYNTSAVTDD
tara:strand:+ start:115 stop:384 length:270 start_codon:yes stop_codon:yes gene_type:complete